jgi:hypothetical protein
MRRRYKLKQKRRLINTYVTKIKPAPEETRPSNIRIKSQLKSTSIKKAELEVAATAE